MKENGMVIWSQTSIPFWSYFVRKILRQKNICSRDFFCFPTIGQKHIVI